MKTRFPLRTLLFAALAGAATMANAGSRMSVETTVYEWTEEEGDEAGYAVSGMPEMSPALASFGPFNVVSADRAELNGSIESETPAQFAAMLRAFPNIRRIDMIDCPGTGDDEANFAVAHMLRKAGISTNVPKGGSVRSGGVELFLAGVKRHADPDAEFAVHSWMDTDGMEADDFAENDPIHQPYLAFYREIGMTPEKAKAFYTMTNSKNHDDALYLKSRDIAAYIPLD